MKVLVACEVSGVVRRAFAARGHDAWSCDLLTATEDVVRPRKHFQGDIFEFLARDPVWDLMIAHPPCTYLTGSGENWMSHPDDTFLHPAFRRPHPLHPNRKQEREST